MISSFPGTGGNIGTGGGGGGGFGTGGGGGGRPPLGAPPGGGGFSSSGSSSRFGSITGGSHHSQRNHGGGGGGNRYATHPPYRVVKCTEVPQFDALQTAADDFRYDDKLHLRNLCNDSARCQGLTAIHLSTTAIVSPTMLTTTATTPSSSTNRGGGPPPDQNNSFDANQSTSSTTPTTTTTAPSQPPAISAFRTRQMILDYSRQQVTGETMELLFDLADAVGLTERREAMREGLHINVTQDRPVLHHLLRMPDDYPSTIPSRDFNTMSTAPTDTNGPTMTNTTNTINGHYYHQPNGPYNSTSNSRTMLHDIVDVRRQIAEFSQEVRSGQYRGVTGEVLTDTIVISASGGMHLGIKALHTALSTDKQASWAASTRRLHFLSNIDPVDTYLTTMGVDPAKTIVIVCSKDFHNSNELMNLRSVRNWLCQHLTKKSMSSSSSSKEDDGDGSTTNSSGAATTPVRKFTETEIIERHIVTVTCNDSKYVHMMGLSKTSTNRRTFRIWDWVIGRFSVCSAVGILPLSLQYSYDVVQDLLAGAHDIDEHFFNAPLRDNIPVLLGLLGVWNSTFMGYTTRCLLPYSEALVDFPAHVQLVDMESNGKRVAIDGEDLHIPAGEIDFGDSGGNAHHAFHQIMHQGRVIPVDFIGFMESPRPIQLPGEALSSHDEFMSNFFAQPDALAYGKTLVDLMQEGVPDGLREHMVFSGNRPSSSLLMTRLDPYSLGQLLALYEHRTAVQGFIWGINSFDQFGLELGKLLSKHIRVQLAASRVGATVQGFNQSTSSLLEAYIAHRKQSN